MSLWKAAPCPNSFLPLVRVFQGDMAYNHDVDLETSAYLVILEEYENCTWEMLWTDEKQTYQKQCAHDHSVWWN